jgi:murein DD-endopeptidase MepM/ murein hydrolase activator NlpD
MISPTGKWLIRKLDDFGVGVYGASRGTRVHKGIDLIVEPQQNLVSPIDGMITREAYPYAGDLKWRGCVIQNKDVQIKMFYMVLNQSMRKNFPTVVTQGEVIGVAQNIANKYNADGKTMIPHIHFEMRIMGPVNPMDYIEEDLW